MTLTIDASNGAMKGTVPAPLSAANDLTDTDEGVYPYVRGVGTFLFRRCRDAFPDHEHAHN